MTTTGVSRAHSVTSDRVFALPYDAGVVEFALEICDTWAMGFVDRGEQIMRLDAS